jgi:hypothetical protein
MSYPSPKIYLGGTLVTNLPAFDVTESPTLSYVLMNRSTTNVIYMYRATVADGSYITNVTTSTGHQWTAGAFPGSTSYSINGSTWFNAFFVSSVDGKTTCTYGLKTDSIEEETTAHGIVSTTIAADGLLAKEFYPVGIASDGQLGTGHNNIITDLTTARTFALTDAFKYIIFNNAGATTATIPANATVAFPLGTEIRVFMLGAGVVTVTPAAGVILQAVALIPVMAQYEGFTLKKVGTNTWNMH